MMLMILYLPFFCKVDTHEFIKVNRSENGKRTDFKQDMIEVNGNNC